ncbi:asparaginase [Pseudomonas duriflava]|nr:asparaginase [Pseudomonas duriflava]
MTTSPRLMVLYTGGTIGMQATEQGLSPASGFDVRMRHFLSQKPGRALPEWHFRELLPLMDSANMTPAYWLKLSAAILEAADQGYTGVLVLHGTDTLAYTAAAMSFHLLGLNIPVILTGSMLPPGVADTDAWENLDGALQTLAAGAPAGVHVYFHGELLHGARCSKIRSAGRHPFQCLTRQRSTTGRVSLPATLLARQSKAVADVAVLPLFPGISARHVQAMVAAGVRGLVLECYGSGTGPSDDEAFLASLRGAHSQGLVIVAVTQCHEGGVELDIYEAGSRLRTVGVVSGGGMTREAALAKLQVLLGLGLSQMDIAYWLEQDLCGERGH